MYPRSGGKGENTPFAKQSKEKEWYKGHDNRRGPRASLYDLALCYLKFYFCYISES